MGKVGRGSTLKKKVTKQADDAPFKLNEIGQKPGIDSSKFQAMHSGGTNPTPSELSQLNPMQRYLMQRTNNFVPGTPQSAAVGNRSDGGFSNQDFQQYVNNPSLMTQNTAADMNFDQYRRMQRVLPSVYSNPNMSQWATSQQGMQALGQFGVFQPPPAQPAAPSTAPLVPSRSQLR